MAKYNTHSLIYAQVSNETIKQIKLIIESERITKSDFIGMLIEAGLQNLNTVCIECEKKKHFFSEIELLRIRIRNLELKNEKN